MANPYNYNELYMHGQRDPLWGNIHLGKSGATMHSFGCLVSCIAYLCSRRLGRDITPGEYVNWLNNDAGFDKYGQYVWGSESRFTSGRLFRTLNPVGANYTVKCVNFAGQTHFVVQLRNPKNGKNDIIYDPWQWPPTLPNFSFVQPASLYKDWPIPRRYYFRTA